MQAKEMQKIADCLKELRPKLDYFEDVTTGNDCWKIVVEHFVKMLDRDNPKYKQHLFLKACGMENDL